MILMCLLSTGVQFGTGRRFYKAAYKAWPTMGMDCLIVLGTTASYVYSVVVLIMRMATHMPTSDDNNNDNNSQVTLEPTFMTSVMLLTFVSMGKWLEAMAKGNTVAAIQSLMELQPAMARKCTLGESSDNTDNNVVDLGSLPTQDVPTAEIVPGDYVKVLPGERLPADGLLVAMSSASPSSLKVPPAQAFLDESSFSGEPFPVSKGVGDFVLGGTVNQQTVLVVQVTAAGSDSVLAQIVHLVEDAQRHKAPIQVYADRVAAVFAPLVITMATVTFVFWLLVSSSSSSTSSSSPTDNNSQHHESMEERVFVALMTAISVVVVACPCALGLATPCAVLVGTGVGAAHGLLIKGGDVLEKMQSVNTVVFDKTGTITSGKATLATVQTLVAPEDHEIYQNLPVESNRLVLWLACVAEINSEHPIGKAIVNAGKAVWKDDILQAQKGVSLQGFLAEPGHGVECVLHSPSWGTFGVRVGKRDWVKEPLTESTGLDDPTGDDDVDAMRRRGEISVYVSIWNAKTDRIRRVVGLVGVSDPIKPEAESTVNALRQLGMDVWMCTGDSSVTAQAVAAKVGIPADRVFSGMTPAGKGDMVADLQLRTVPRPHRTLFNFRKPPNRTVAMVADGVNDAVALAKADVGFAIGAGTQVAVEAADVVLVKSDLHDVVVALHLSSVVFRRIVFNLCCAMVYNVCALPFAAGMLTPFTDVRLPPAAAGFMMAVSSVSVVTSSLLLKTYRKPCISEDGKLATRRFLPVSLSGRHTMTKHASSKYTGVPTNAPSEFELV
uniref:P-type ATPase A domain-containing protein n=1 Tax=Amphora coffeiformis TaxID=265554 RepID=A0A7S3L568_9STRA